MIHIHLLSRFGGMYSVNSPKSTFKYKHNLHKNFKSHRVCLFWLYLLKFVRGMSSSLQTFVLLIPLSFKISSIRKWRWPKSVTYSFVLCMWNISYKSIFLFYRISHIYVIHTCVTHRCVMSFVYKSKYWFSLMKSDEVVNILKHINNFSLFLYSFWYFNPSLKELSDLEHSFLILWIDRSPFAISIGICKSIQGVFTTISLLIENSSFWIL